MTDVLAEVVDIQPTPTLTYQALVEMVLEARFHHAHDVWRIQEGVHGKARYHGWCDEYEEVVLEWNRDLLVPLSRNRHSAIPEPTREMFTDVSAPFPPPERTERRTYAWVERYVLDVARTQTVEVPASLTDDEITPGLGLGEVAHIERANGALRIYLPSDKGQMSLRELGYRSLYESPRRT